MGWLRDRDSEVERLLDGLPATPIAVALSGALVKVVGRIEADATLAGPLSGEPCVLAEAALETHGVLRGFSTDGAQVDALPFLLRDDTGVARVLPDRALPALRRTVRRDGEDRRCSEALLRPVDTVAILGRVHLEAPAPEEAQGYRALQGRRVVISAPADGPLLLSNLRGALRTGAIPASRPSSR